MSKHTATVHQFVRCNLQSPVVACRLEKTGGGWYRLKDGNQFRLSAASMERLAEFSGRTGFSIRHEENAGDDQ